MCRQRRRGLLLPSVVCCCFFVVDEWNDDEGVSTQQRAFRTSERSGERNEKDFSCFAHLTQHGPFGSGVSRVRNIRKLRRLGKLCIYKCLWKRRSQKRRSRQSQSTIFGKIIRVLPKQNTIIIPPSPSLLSRTTFCTSIVIAKMLFLHLPRPLPVASWDPMTRNELWGPLLGALAYSRRLIVAALCCCYCYY